MKNTLFVLATMALLAGCSKHDATPEPQPQPIIVKDVNIPLYFKATPQSPNELKISFQSSDAERGLVKLYLKKDTSTLGAYTLTGDGSNYYSTVVNYNFSAGQSYKLIVESNGVNDTAFRYTLPPYTHTYLGPFQYEKLLTLAQSLGPKAFDISPSRKTIFITDAVHNTTITKKLSLTDGKIDTLGDITDGLMIRAISDSEILVLTSTYNHRRLQDDSAALNRHNVYTGQSSFIDFASINYGRFSRVINNHILVTEPFNGGSCNSALIDLKDNSKILYPYSSFSFQLISELSFDHLYYQNYVVDPATGALQTKLSLTDSSGIEYIDNPTGYTIVSKYVPEPSKHDYYSSRFSVYSNTSLLYQDSSYVKDRTLGVGRQMIINNDRILLYQYFGYDTTYRTDGYYSLDLNTRRLSQVQSDSNPYYIMDFQLDPHQMISVRADGVYRLRLP